MTEFQFFLETLLHTLTLLALLVGLFGLFIPIFPGLTVMWIATLVFALIQAAGGQMAFIDWFLFALITLLMLGGNLIDNLFMGNEARRSGADWLSIVVALVAGIAGTFILPPFGGILFAAVSILIVEWVRRKDLKESLKSTGGILKGCGFAVAARFGIGVVMILMWVAWVLWL